MLVTAVGFKPTSSRVQAGRSDQAELHRGGRPGVNQTLVSRVSDVRSVIELLVFGNPGET